LKGREIKMRYLLGHLILSILFVGTASWVSLTETTYIRARIGVAMLSKASLSEISASISKATGRAFTAKYPASGGMSGGGGASVGTIEDVHDPSRSYFYKAAGLYEFDMLRAEYHGISSMFSTNTIKVPQPICYGTSDAVSYAIFERLSLGGYGVGDKLGEKLAAMHQCTSPNNMFGYDIDNTIGATPQPNKWCSSWTEFWLTHRLGHMLSLCKRDGATFPYERELVEKVKAILDDHDCQPSLVHGDLWSGNQAYTKEGEPVIFDPATYVSWGVSSGWR
jgi:fructosamine-3-kinase